MQREYIDLGDLYAPTFASSSVRLLAALACELDLEFTISISTRLL